MNEPIAAIIVGLLLSLSAGVRVTLPLLAVNLLAFYHEIALPENMAWLGTQPTLIILSVACAAETVVHFIPVAGTYLKAMTAPANVASLGIFGLIWNIGELVVSLLLAALGGICVLAGWIVGAVILLAVVALVLIALVKTLTKMERFRFG